MRSRELPDDFDMTQGLHSPFGPDFNVDSISTQTLASVPLDISLLHQLRQQRQQSLELERKQPVGTAFQELERMLREWTRAYELTEDR